MSQGLKKGQEFAAGEGKGGPRWEKGRSKGLEERHQGSGPPFLVGPTPPLLGSVRYPKVSQTCP